ncbi:MAG: Gfo/Idh/MocA family oxidoreductase [Faecalibacterium sp.]
MSNPVFHVGIIGCGTIAPMHANALASNEQTIFAACADVNFERATTFAAQYGCKAYASAEEMLESEALDAVHICTTHATHFPLIQLAAQKGLAVFTEKPPTTNRADFAQLLALAEAHPIGVCFQNRYNDSVLAVKKRLVAGEFGKLQGARGFVTWHRDADYYAAAPWRGTWQEAAGGSLINQSIHTLDLMVEFLGKPDKVTSQMAQLHLSEPVEVEDSLHALLRYDDGKRGVFYATNGYFTDERVLLELACEHAILRIEQELVTIRWCEEAKPSEVLSFARGNGGGKSYWGSSHALCIADFYAARAEGRPFQNEPSKVAAVMETMFAIYEQNTK